jgi:hypothetical protein
MEDIEKKYQEFEKRTEEFNDIYYNKIGLCGCGNPEDLKVFLFKILSAQNKHKEGEIPYEEMLRLREEAFKECGLDVIIEFIFHILDDKKLFEHGGYIGNGWLSDNGKKFLALLEEQIKGFEP